MINLINYIMIIIITIIGIGIGLWVYISDKKSLLNIIFLSMITGFLLTTIAFFIAEKLNITIEQRLIWSRISFGSASFSAYVTYLFIKYFPTKKWNYYFVDYLMIILGSFILILSVFTDKIIKNVKFSQESVEMVAGDLMALYYSIYVLFAVVVLFILFKKYYYSNIKKIEKRQIKYLILGFLIFVIFNIIFNIIFPIILKTEKFYYIGDYSVIFFFVLAAYAIVKHGLFDVRLAIVRSVTYALLLSTLAGVYAIITFTISAIFNLEQSNSPWQITTNIMTSLLLVIIFQPLKRLFDRVTNKIFYKDNYDTDEFFARLSKSISITTDLRGLLERAAYEIGDTLKAEQAFFFIYTTSDGNYMTAGTERHNFLPKADAIAIESLFRGKNDIILSDSLEHNHAIKRMMISHQIELILPLIQKGAIIGFLCLGEHKNSIYTSRDVKVLYTISNELMIAIKNALAVQEIREFNVTLQQRIANATKELRANNTILRQLDKVKDEFISMASHQLRTPLTSVKGYLSMVIEGDVGKVSESQKKLLDQAFMSSENMVHLINDFLNVSRIQSGKFVIDKTPVDLSELIQQETDSLVPNAKMRNIKLVYKKPKDFPIIQLDESKIRQVVMNFSDNAIYYSGENTKVIISLSVEGKDAIFTVKDNGIGVPAKEREQLFSKFYRASNAKVKRPDGTGVGIYLAKKVIDSLGGKIIFESTEGKGSIFGFRLPIK